MSKWGEYFNQPPTECEDDDGKYIIVEQPPLIDDREIIVMGRQSIKKYADPPPPPAAPSSGQAATSQDPSAMTSGEGNEPEGCDYKAAPEKPCGQPVYYHDRGTSRCYNHPIASYPQKGMYCHNYINKVIKDRHGKVLETRRVMCGKPGDNMEGRLNDDFTCFKCNPPTHPVSCSVIDPTTGIQCPQTGIAPGFADPHGDDRNWQCAFHSGLTVEVQEEMHKRAEGRAKPTKHWSNMQRDPRRERRWSFPPRDDYSQTQSAAATTSQWGSECYLTEEPATYVDDEQTYVQQQETEYERQEPLIDTVAPAESRSSQGGYGYGSYGYGSYGGSSQGESSSSASGQAPPADSGSSSGAKERLAEYDRHMHELEKTSRRRRKH